MLCRDRRTEGGEFLDHELNQIPSRTFRPASTSAAGLPSASRQPTSSVIALDFFTVPCGAR
jgi:hypothetical protein